MSTTTTIVGAIWMIASFAMYFGGHGHDNAHGIATTLTFMNLAPIEVILVRMIILPNRDYGAGRMEAVPCANPLSLASTLDRL